MDEWNGINHLPRLRLNITVMEMDVLDILNKTVPYPCERELCYNLSLLIISLLILIIRKLIAV